MERSTQKAIRRVIKERGLTQTEVANQLGVTKARVSQILNHPPSRRKRQGGPPAILTAERFAKVLGVPVATLETHRERPNPVTAIDQLRGRLRSAPDGLKTWQTSKTAARASGVRQFKPPDHVREYSDGLNCPVIVELPAGIRIQPTIETLGQTVVILVALRSLAQSTDMPECWRNSAWGMHNKFRDLLLEVRMPGAHSGGSQDFQAGQIDIDETIDDLRNVLIGYESR